MKRGKLMTAFIAAIFLISSCGQAWNGKQDDTKAKYIFLFIGDGMGANHVAAAESYLSYKAGKIGGEQLVFTTFPYHGTATNFSANRHVTCSAASGTAIACGSKTDNSKLGMDKDGNALKSVAKELKEDGYKIGIITTVPVNHATLELSMPVSHTEVTTTRSAASCPKADSSFLPAPGSLTSAAPKMTCSRLTNIFRSADITCAMALRNSIPFLTAHAKLYSVKKVTVRKAQTTM